MVSTALAAHVQLVGEVEVEREERERERERERETAYTVNMNCKIYHTAIVMRVTCKLQTVTYPDTLL